MGGAAQRGTGTRRPSGFGVAALFSAALALAGLGGLFSWFAIRAQLHDAAWVSHTDEVISQLQHLRFLVVRAEAAQRAYLILAEDDTRAWYRTAAAQVPALLERIRALTRDNPVQQAKLGELQHALDRRLGQYEAGVRAVEAGGPAAAPGFLGGSGWREVDARWQGLVADLIGHEQSLLAIRTRQATASGKATLTGILITTGLALVAAGTGTALVRRYLAVERLRARGEAQERERLEMAVRERTAQLEAAVADLTAANIATAQSEERFRLLVEGVRDHAVFLLDADGLVASWNPGAERIKQWTAAEIIGRHLRVLYLPEEQAAHVPERALAQAARDGIVQMVGIRVRKDGSQFHAEVSITALYHADGSLRGFAKITRDVTERVAAERALREHEARTRAIVDTAPDAVMTLDEDGSVREANRAAVALFGWPAEELAGRPIDTIVEGVRLDGPERSEAVGCRRDGSPVPLEIALGGFRVGGRRQVTAILRDISDRRRAEEQLREHAAELERRVEERTAALRGVVAELEAFSYSVSHDLRAPLRAIAGFARALAEDGADRLDPECSDHLRRITAATARMGELIDGLLELSRVSRGEIGVDAVDLSGLAREVVADLRRADPARAVETVIADGIRVRGDRRLLRAALDNLIGNAWKFTGRVEHPRIEVSAAPAGAGLVEIAVRDNGAGFAPADAARLFTPFQRLHRDYPGTGIGLATVQRIAARHGGSIRAEAEAGHGATFFLTLPRA